MRPIGLADPQGAAPPRPPQFYWLWAPLNFADRFMLYHNNADADGTPWNTASVVGATGRCGRRRTWRTCRSELAFKSGTRHAKVRDDRRRRRAGQANGAPTLTPRFNFYMSGIGYMHPEWGHGQYKGETALGYDTFDLAT